MINTLTAGLLLVLICALLGLFVSKSNKLGPLLPASLFTIHSLKISSIIFAAALLISVPLVHYLTFDQSYKSVGNTDPIIDLYQTGIEGKLEQIPGIFVKSKWSFETKSERMEVSGDATLLMLGKRKDIDDGFIEVGYYIQRSTWDGTDITDKMLAPKIILVGNSLIINRMPEVNIEMTRFVPDFTVKQFQKREHLDGTGGYTGSGVLMIHFPKSMTLDANNGSIRIIGK